MKKPFVHWRAAAVIAIVLAVSLLGAGVSFFRRYIQDGEVVNLRSTVPHRIILDCDAGGDDVGAILLAAACDQIDILGVTVSAGNVTLEQAAKNALATLEFVGCDAPVYRGADRPFHGEPQEVFSVYGTDGMGDAGIIHPTGTTAEGHAVDFILETVRSAPGEVEIVALGPVTNLALALEKDPETMALVKRVWSMGTAGYGEGNATPVAEFNVYKDAPAYRKLLESGLPITIMPLDTISESGLVLGEKELGDRHLNKMDEFLAPAFRALAAFNRESTGEYFALIPDVVTMAALVWDDFVAESIPCSAVCVTEPGETYGQVIFYRADRLYEANGLRIPDPNISLARKINKKYHYSK